MAPALSRTAVNATLKAAIAETAAYAEPGASMLFLNGRALNTDKIDPFHILEVLIEEAAVLEDLGGGCACLVCDIL